MRHTAIKVLLIGSPNVGKSAIFNYLTSSYVAVSNYPGTTVDIATGHFEFAGQRFEVIDTPGMYSLIPLTDEEKVTRLLLSRQVPDVVIHVVDAKNIRRMLNMTLQLIDAGAPVILNLNIMDEAQHMGMLIDVRMLEKLLGIPVVATSAIHKTGLGVLRLAVSQYQRVKPAICMLSDELEQAVQRISSRLTDSYGFNKRLAALLVLQGDAMMMATARQEAVWPEIAAVITQLAANKKNSLEALIAAERQAIVDKIVAQTVRYARFERDKMSSLANWLGKITREPLTGVPILCFVLDFGLYQFVGKFGAGYLVDYINNRLFILVLNPLAAGVIHDFIPWEWLQSLLVGEYGIVTMGVRYAAAIIVPIVGTFFLVFAVLEDTGYLPRLAMLVDSVFRCFGLNGRAVIPFT
ncbi:MAG: FeoB small GTPase domain-containing protein, partial [Sporomusa sp.]